MPFSNPLNTYGQPLNTDRTAPSFCGTHGENALTVSKGYWQGRKCTAEVGWEQQFPHWVTLRLQSSNALDQMITSVGPHALT